MTSHDSHDILLLRLTFKSQSQGSNLGLKTGDAAQRQTHGRRAPGAGIDLLDPQVLIFVGRDHGLIQVR